MRAGLLRRAAHESEGRVWRRGGGARHVLRDELPRLAPVRRDGRLELLVLLLRPGLCAWGGNACQWRWHGGARRRRKEKRKGPVRPRHLPLRLFSTFPRSHLALHWYAVRPGTLAATRCQSTDDTVTPAGAAAPGAGGGSAARPPASGSVG